MIRIKKFISIAAAAAMLCLFCSCAAAHIGTANNAAVTAEDADENIETTGAIQMSDTISYSFDSVLQMKKTVPEGDRASVLLKGYYYPNDGGGGMFYWDASSASEPDGGLVIAANDSENGRYIRICASDYRNVKWFGAVGTGSTNDTAAIKAAVASLPASGGTVRFPGGTYCLTETIQIGNGDGEGTRSDINGIKLIGCGAGFGVYGNKEPTQIRATKNIDAMVSVNGRISDVLIEGIGFNAESLAKKCISATAVNSLVVRNVVCKMFTEAGLYIIGGKGNGNGNYGCRFESVSGISTTNGVKCLYIDGNDETCPTENCTFIDCRFDHHTTEGSVSGHIKCARGLSFYRCHFAGYNQEKSDFLVLDASVDGLPEANTFYDCSIFNVKVIERDGRSIGHNFFYGYGTYDNEDIPDHPMLSGITDSGLPFRIGGE